MHKVIWKFFPEDEWEVLGVFASETKAIRFAESEYDRLVKRCLKGANREWWQSIVVEVVDA